MFNYILPIDSFFNLQLVLYYSSFFWIISHELSGKQIYYYCFASLHYKRFCSRAYDISVLNIPYWKDFFPPSNFDFGEIQIFCFVGSAFFPSRFLSLKLGFYLKLFGDCGGGHDFSFSFFPLATLSFFGL